MAEDWYADVKKYVPNADSGVVAAIVRYCGIALQNRDSSLVSFSDPVEVGRVRDNFLKKKLGLTDSDDDLNRAIAAVGERMKDDQTKNRVTVYYLLAEHFRKLSLFGGVEPVADAGAAAGVGAGAAGLAGAGAAAAAGLGARPANTDARPAATATAQPFASTAPAAPAARSGLMRWLPWLILLAALLLLWWLFTQRHAATTPVASTDATAPAAATATAPEAATTTTAPAVAEAPATAAATAGLPANVYFDVGSATVSGDGAKAIAAAADAIKKDSLKVAITGYTDKTGDTAKNQELAKNRAKAVRAALEAAGVPEASIEMRPPLTVEVGASNAGDSEARRVEITKV